MNANTDSELNTFVLLQTGIKVSHRSEDSQPSPYCSVRIIFVCHWIAEIDEETIPKQLSNMSIKASDDLGADPVVCLDDFAKVFRVELGRKGGRFDEVDEHHRELPSFRVRRRCRRARCDLRGRLCLGSM